MTKAMGIVGCQVLEDEIAYIVAKDDEFKRVVIVDNTEEKTLADKIARMAPDKSILSYSDATDVKEYQLGGSDSLVIWLMSICLHQSPPLLREEVLKTINKIAPVTDSVLIFYGQCGSAFVNLDILSQEVHVPITILKDSDGSLIDDCFGTVLGGKEQYRLFLVNQKGPAYVLNSMWAANWRHFMQEFQMLHDPNDLEEVMEVFKYMDYKKVVGLNTGLVDDAVFHEQLHEFCSIFGLEMENHSCTLDLVDSSYHEAKVLLNHPGTRV